MSKKHKLGEWYATAISSNNILSSVLYVSGISIIFAGVFAPLVLIIVGLLLVLYKSIYIEIVEALPINGGVYNCLLNSTSKSLAAIAGLLTIFSYVTAAVISGKIAIEYLNTIITVPVVPLTICLLAFFAILVQTGMKDSAKVSFIIFLFHIITLVIFVAVGYWWLLHHKAFYMINLLESQKIFANGGMIQAIFLGFAASLVGISGFESSANFVEEQKTGVFRKTLKHMLFGVMLFHPLIAFIILGTSSIATVGAAKEFLLAQQAHIVGGPIFQYIVVIDAFFVLAGAVLTSFIGVSGLIYRMASDACLPNFLTKKNKQGTYPRIAILFFLLCTAILILTKGNLLSLAGVYTLSFLSVMSLFALGNLVLKETRPELKRTHHAPLSFVVLALLATLVGMVGNIMIDSMNIIYFAIYFIPALFVILAIVFQDMTVRVLLRCTQYLPPIHRYLEKYFLDVRKGEMVAFVNHVGRLHEILSYIDRNEAVKNITLVHCKNWDNTSDMDRYHEIKDMLPNLQKAGVFPDFTIRFLYKSKPFGPEVIDDVSKELKVRKNRILIGSIQHFHDFDYADLGDVRIIF